MTLYIEILRKILNEETIDHDRDGFYLASPGAIAWSDLYKQMAKALAKRGVVDDDTLHNVSDASLEEAAKALGCPKEFVPVEMGGSYVLALPLEINALLTSILAVRCKPIAERKSAGSQIIPLSTLLRMRTTKYS